MRKDELNPGIDNVKAARRELAFLGLVGPGSKLLDGLAYLGLTYQNADERDSNTELDKLNLIYKEAKAKDIDHPRASRGRLARRSLEVRKSSADRDEPGCPLCCRAVRESYRVRRSTGLFVFPNQSRTSLPSPT